MKGKFKLILLSMLALFLVACGSATPSPDGGGTGGGTSGEITPKPGGGTGTGGGTSGEITPEPGGGTGTGGGTSGEITPEPEEPKQDADSPVDPVEWGIFDSEKMPIAVNDLNKFDVNKTNGISYDSNTFSINQKHFNPLAPSFSDSYQVVYNTELFQGKLGESEKIEDMNLKTNSGSYLVFKNNVGEIKFKEIDNKGYMFFVEETKGHKEYTITLNKKDTIKGNGVDFKNEGNIYVMDRNYGSTLKINGNYDSLGLDASIYLGLYISEEKTTFSTDKVHINGNAGGQTKVHFIYNEGQVEKLKEGAEYYEENYVIKVDGDVPKGQNAFEMTPFPEGLNIFDFKYYKKEGVTDSHLWKLEKK